MLGLLLVLVHWGPIFRREGRKGRNIWRRVKNREGGETYIIRADGLFRGY
jgi:hypothetical protein